MVVGGSAQVEVARGITRVEQGSSVLFEAMESHVVHNDSVDTPLCIVAARWAPAIATAA